MCASGGMPTHTCVLATMGGLACGVGPLRLLLVSRRLCVLPLGGRLRACRPLPPTLAPALIPAPLAGGPQLLVLSTGRLGAVPQRLPCSLPARASAPPALRAAPLTRPLTPQRIQQGSRQFGALPGAGAAAAAPAVPAPAATPAPPPSASRAPPSHGHLSA